MIESHKLQVRMSEVRQRLNELAGDENADGAAVDGLAAEMGTLEARYRAALTVEAHEDDKAEAHEAKTPETRELGELRGRVELRDYLLEAANGRAAHGAAAEFRAAIMGENAREGVVPWEALLALEEREEREERADAATVGPTTGPANQRGIIARVFARSAAAFLGVEMPRVPVGQSLFPVMTGGATGSMLAAGAAKNAEAATFTVEALSPVRLSARYLFRVEDLAKLRGMEDALRADLRAAMSDAMDAQVLAGDGTAPNQAGFLDALTEPDAPAAVADFGSILGAHVSGVDGLYAHGLADVRMLTGPATYKLAAAAFRTTGDVASSDYLATHSGGLRASANVPAPDTNIQGAITYATGGPGSAVAPVWEGLELIRDPYTNAASGEVSLTAVALWAFRIVRTAPYAWQKFKLA